MEEFRFTPSTEVQRIRDGLDHPILDGDGHQVEFLPLVVDLIGEIGGKSAANAFRECQSTGFANPALQRIRGFFQYPARNTLDLMSVTLPKLLHHRLDELGIDFALIYPSTGLAVSMIAADELRQVTARACNTYSAELFAGYRDRLEPVAVIPMGTPAEATAELDYAVSHLGLKAVLMSGPVPRTVRPDGTQAAWIDTLGHDSLYDYDPVWAKCSTLGVSPAFHGMGNGWGSRISSKNYVYNHIGHFATAQEAICRSLVMGGVPRRFPELRFSFLEGGATWAIQLLADFLGHYAKRNKDAVKMFDPTEQDPLLRRSLFQAFAEGRLVSWADRLDEALGSRGALSDGGSFDDFADAAIAGPIDLVNTFTQQFYFGCEADDRMNTLLFNRDLLPGQVLLNGILASDIGHFDVPDMRQVLVEAWRVVEDRVITKEDFRRFACENLVGMLTANNPDFFADTVVETLAANRPIHGPQPRGIRN